MMKELYDITVLFLRCLRNFEKWSWILILRKNEGKMRKNRVKWLSLSPQIYTTNETSICKYRFYLPNYQCCT